MTGGLDGKILVWDLKTKQIVTKIQNDDSVTSVAMSNGSKYVAVGGLNGKVTLYNIKTGEIKNSYNGHNQMVTSVALSMCVFEES